MSIQTPTLPIVLHQSWQPKLFNALPVAMLVYLCLAALVFAITIVKEVIIRAPESTVTDVQNMTLPFTLHQSWKSRLLWALGGALLVYVSATAIAELIHGLIWKTLHHTALNLVVTSALLGLLCVSLLLFSMCFQGACYLKLDAEGLTYCHFWWKRRLKWSEITDIKLERPLKSLTRCACVKYFIGVRNQYSYTKIVYISDMHSVRHKELVLLMQSIRSKAACPA